MSKEYKLPKAQLSKYITHLRTTTLRPLRGMFFNPEVYRGQADYNEVFDHKRLTSCCVVGLWRVHIDSSDTFVGDPEQNLGGHLIELFDHQEMSFAEIADWLEQNVEGV